MNFVRKYSAKFISNPKDYQIYEVFTHLLILQLFLIDNLKSHIILKDDCYFCDLILNKKR
ncbi:hypothetical protein BpHYR1_042036 [Brachionus plicatilis]|uniref:Uncharacterized protein n=1 Tax=Brachionus plicatilis TaxID=10195 RepID=A0A3M7PTI0_BRAPC|nr:hypothetical protein BpHYR1_042036 [Brachionus plicatilis]